MRRALSAVVFAVSSTMSLPVGAETPSWSLDWVVPPECPGPAQVRARVATLLGPSRRTETVISARVLVSRAPSGYHAAMQTVGREGSGERSFDGATCADIADAAALIVALLIDPDALASPPPPTPAPLPAPTGSAPAPAPAPAPVVRAPAPGPVPSPAPGPAPAAAPSPSPSPSPSPTPALAPAPSLAALTPSPTPSRPTTPALPPPLLVSIDAVAAVGLLPGLAPSVGLSVGYRLDRLRLAATASYWPSETATLSSSSLGSASVDLVTGGASGCLAVARTRRLDAGPCASVELGRMHATPNVPKPDLQNESALWWAAGAGIYASVLAISPVAMTAEIGAWFPLVTPRFGVSSSTLFEPGPVEARVRLSAEVRF